MNLTRAFDVALPELPSRRFREQRFRFDPKTVARVHEEPDRVVVRVLAPNSRKVMNMTPNQWKLVQMFDGRRSNEQLALWWRKTCGVASTPDFVRTFAESLDEVNFWHKEPHEESAALAQDLLDKRQRRQQQANDFSRIYLKVFDPDKYLTAIYRWIHFVYRPWFVALTLCAIGWMLFTWFSRSADVWRDSLAYWNMADKRLRDVAEFYLIFLVVGFFHESGHALTVKHFGGQVRRMGLLLVYTTPAFFVDMSQIWLYRSRRERCLNTLAGFWVELSLCAGATLVWSGTAAGTAVHDFAYKFILVGGIMPVLFNMNPLMRLDGYLFVCEFFRLPNLREKSTAFLTAWVRRHIFRMPITVPALSPRRALLYALFAFSAGAYTYLVLLFLSKLTYKVFYRITPEWAFLPATLVALRIFRSRIETFMAFLKALYLDKKDLVQRHRRIAFALAAAALLFAFLPLWHDSVVAPFVLEASSDAIVRAKVPGRVVDMIAREGMHVRAGDVIARLSGPDVESTAARAQMELAAASAREFAARLQYANESSAGAEQRRSVAVAHLESERSSELTLRTPIAGTVVTPRLDDLLDTWIAPGMTVVEVQDLSQLRARIFIPEADMRTLGEISSVSVKLPMRFGALRGQLESVSPGALPVEPGLIPAEKYKGIAPPPYYVALAKVPNSDGGLRTGIKGEAKIFGARRSLAGMAVRPVRDFILRKIW